MSSVSFGSGGGDANNNNANASSGASEHDSTADGGRRVQPQRLELTLSPEDGSLATAPLSSVIVAATDALYADLYDMTHGEIEVTTTAAQTTSAAAAGGGMDGGSEHPASAAADTDAGAATAAAAPASAVAPPAAPSGNYAAHMAALSASAKKEKMASLSFAQRRHELASRIARHSRAISHVAGLVGGYGYDHQPRGGSQQQRRRGQQHQHHGGGGGKMPAPGELASIVDLSSRTFRHVRQSWVQADEAQDALYFHHDQLWKARRHVHDVRGALAVVCGGADDGGRAGKEVGDKAADADDMDGGDESKTTTDGAAASASALAGFAGRWVDFPTDAALLVDRYETSNEKSLTKAEVLERLRGAVRRKLVLGEVGSVVAAAAAADAAGNATDVERFKLPWRIALEGGGGAVRLTYGEPRSFSVRADGGVDNNGGSSSNSSSDNTGGAGSDVYPIEARLTVLSESDESEDPSSETRKPAEWTLLSVRTSVSAKTGESNHQLDLTRRQMFDLHRLCVRAMTVEEAQARKANELLAAAAAAADGDAKAENEEEKNGAGGGTKKEEEGVPMEIDSSSAAAASTTPTDAKSSSGNSKAPSFPAALRRRDGTVVARPLSCLFDVAHTFAASLQLEVLSSQAVALQRGAWGGIAVSPVHFFDRGVDGSKTKKAEGKAKIVGVGADRGHDEDGGEAAAAAAAAPLAVMAMHFWAVDDRYGHPALGDLTPETAASPPMAKSQSQPIKGEPAAAPKAAESAAAADLASVTSSVRSKRTSASVRTTTERHLPPSDDRGNGRLTLSLRAVPGMGVVAAISGGDGVAAALAEGGGGDGSAGDGGTGGGDANMGDDDEERQRAAARRRHVRRNATKLLTATSDPFSLSASDALLAATVLCAERRSEAVASALLRGGTRKGTSGTSAAASLSPSSSSPLLPAWLDLEVECGTISVAARISYLGGGGGDGEQEEDNGFVELFRLACDSRTGRFVPTFPRAASLLRSLACNDPRASELQTLRNAVVSSRGRNVPSTQKRRNVGSDLTGRAVRDAFEGLARSVDVLGRRVGVGGSWVDADRTSPSLRDRSVDLACGDVRSSLLACSGAAAVYGVSALALGACSGVDAAADVAGGPIVARADSTDKPTSNGAADIEGGESSSPPLLPIPPLGIVTSQHMIEKKETGADGEVKTVTLLEREVFAVSASVADDALTVRCFDVTTHIESPSLPPTRISCVPAPLAAKKEDTTPYDASADEESRPTKRSRIEKSSSAGPSTSGRHRQMLHEVELLAARFGNTLY